MRNSPVILTSISSFRSALKNFCGDRENDLFLFAIPVSSNNVSFVSEAPSPDKIKKKCVLIIRARSKSELEEPKLTKENMADEVIFMEINQDVLANLHGICSGVYMPILGNPLNMIGWSDLVS